MMPALFARMLARVTIESPSACWVWTGGVQSQGYGLVSGGRRGVRFLTHRVAFEAFRGPIPDGLILDHLCRNRRCVNPWHLDPVTQFENAARGEKPHRTHCPSGHAYTAANTRWFRQTSTHHGGRQCRQCHRERAAARAAA